MVKIIKNNLLKNIFKISNPLGIDDELLDELTESCQKYIEAKRAYETYVNKKDRD